MNDVICRDCPWPPESRINSCGEAYVTTACPVWPLQPLPSSWLIWCSVYARFWPWSWELLPCSYLRGLEGLYDHVGWQWQCVRAVDKEIVPVASSLLSWPWMGATVQSREGQDCHGI